MLGIKATSREVYATWSSGKHGRDATKHKSDGPNVNVERGGIPVHNDKKVYYNHLSVKGCPGRLISVSSQTLALFSKKLDLTDVALAALKHHFGPLRREVQ